MPLSIANPWVIIGLLIAFAGAWFHGNHHGHQAEKKEWQVAQAALDKAADEKLFKALEAARVKEAALMALNTETEKRNADQLNRINGLRIANGRLVAAAGGLFDKNGRPRAQGNSDAGPETSAAAGGVGGGASGCMLSGELETFLQSRFYDADRAAVFAGTCKAYVVKLRTEMADACKPAEDQ